MFTWPKLEMTDYERLWCRPYKTKGKDAKGNPTMFSGVLRRVYPLLITNNTDLGDPGAQIQIARRSRVFGLTFSGDISYTRLQITNASGTTYTVGDPRTAKQAYISTLISGSAYMLGGAIGPKPKFDPIDTSDAATSMWIGVAEQAAPMLIEPNWVLTPNETLIFNGDWTDALEDQEDDTWLVNIAVHVWEFPNMGNADKAVREVL